MKKILLLSACVMSLLQAAEYKVKVKGTSAGKAELSLVTAGNNYSVDLTLCPNTLAKMFGITDMKDSSKGIVENGHYYPKTYRRHTLKGESLFAVDFLDGKAKTTNKGKTKTIKINPLGQDPLTQIAQIKADISNNQLADKYYLITEKSQRTFSAALETTENNQLLVTLTQTPNAKRIIRLWFDYQGELLRMQKEKNSKIDFDMTQ